MAVELLSLKSGCNFGLDRLYDLRIKFQEQGDMVRDMKAAKAPEIDVKAAVSELKKRKKALQDKENELTADDIKIDRNAFETCLKKRFIFRQERFRQL